MKCHDIEALFSDRLDGALTGAREAAFEGHLEGCPGCRAEYSRFRGAVTALRTAPLPSTSAPSCSAILSAVDADVAVRDRRRRVGTHLVAALIGAAAALLVFWLWPAHRPAPSHRPETVERIVDRIVEVPKIVERTVEVPVEVSVEHIVHVYTERFVDRVVEVPKIVEVERVIERGPLIRWDAASLVAFGRELRAAAMVLASRIQSVPPAKDSSDGSSRVRAGVVLAGHEHSPQRASVNVHREAGRVSLRMRGPLRELVPLLLAKRDASDTLVKALVERRLAALRAMAVADPEIGPKLVDPTPADSGERQTLRSRLFGGESEAVAAPTRWAEWWALNADLLASAGPRVIL